MKIDGTKQIVGNTYQVLAKHAVSYACMWEGCELPVKQLGKNQTALRALDPKYVGQLKTHRKYCRLHGAEAGLLGHKRVAMRQKSVKAWAEIL